MYFGNEDKQLRKKMQTIDPIVNMELLFLGQSSLIQVVQG